MVSFQDLMPPSAANNAANNHDNDDDDDEGDFVLFDHRAWRTFHSRFEMPIGLLSTGDQGLSSWVCWRIISRVC